MPHCLTKNLLLDSSPNHLHLKWFLPLQQGHLLVHVPLHKERKLLSFWQNGSASDHFREGKRGSKSDSSKQTCIAQAVRPAVFRGRVRPERCAAGYLCPSHRLSSPL